MLAEQWTAMRTTMLSTHLASLSLGPCSLQNVRIFLFLFGGWFIDQQTRCTTRKAQSGRRTHACTERRASQIGAVAAGMVGALLTPGCPSPAFARFAALRQRVRDRERARSDSADGQIHVDSQGGRRATGRRSRLRRGARRRGVRRRWPLSGGASALPLIEEGAAPVRRAPAGP